MIRYRKEFNQSLVEMHNQGRSYADLSAEYGPSVDSIRNWVKLYAFHEVDGEKWTQADVNALQKENDKLREELEILKRAAVLLSKYN
ncbi:transposase [Bifidobacterium animalis]|uniref:transposase n=1 Tax=Bifidobacterium animalis TaxID=28025 RepID=UPI001C37584B|nr:transposase [Bifidobacterium animalis]MBV3320410.1 transposase [Bifidobacterium animalis]